jgi:hypothetical protein
MAFRPKFQQAFGGFDENPLALGPGRPLAGRIEPPIGHQRRLICGKPAVTQGDTMTARIKSGPLVPGAALLLLAGLTAAQAGQCTRQGVDVTCDDGRKGLLQGDAILWPDGTHSRLKGHDSVIIGNKASVHVGKGVFVGRGNGTSEPMEDPSGPNKLTCAVLDGVSYCN